MNKIFLGAILGISIVGGAAASIVSRGFFEEQIGNYATLDLLNSKANQSDLTALSDKIGRLEFDGLEWELVFGGINFVGLGFLYDYQLNTVEDWLDFLIRDYKNNVIKTIFDVIEHGYNAYSGFNWIFIKGMPELTDDVNTINTKIGELPAKYKTIGAALSAIEGIAEDAKTLAEKAIPDPRAEGSSGKFVLTVDVIGDNATYHWEKIDRTLDEIQTVSE